MQTLAHKNRTFNIKNQYGLSFDGVNEYINIDNVKTALATTTVGTFSAWIKPVDATPTENKRIISFGDTNANELIDFYNSTTGLLGAVVVDAGVTGWDLDTDAAAFSDGIWTHVALVQDGVSPVLYVNGTAVAQTFTTSTDKTKWFSALTGLDNGRIGNLSFNNLGEVRFYNGNIDEVALFNTNLTAAQVLEIYNGGKPTNLNSHSKSANLVYYPRMGEATAIHDGTNWQIPNSKSGLENKKSILFDGVNEYVDLGNIFNEYIAGASKQFSWSFWVKRPAASVSDQIINKWDNTVANQRELNILWHSDNKFYFYQSTTGSDAPVVVTTNTFTGTTWYHVVCTYDGTAVAGVGRFKIYVNGTSEAITLTGTVGDYFSGTANLQFADNSYGTNPLNGNLDEIRFYNTTLTQAQVTALYNLGTPAEAKDSLTDANLISHWRMGDAPLDTATVIEDVYGSNNGTGVNLEAADLEYDSPMLGVSVNMEAADLSTGKL